MDVMEAVSKRYSVRRYEDRPVEAEKLERVLEAARLAPSAKNLQEWRFVVVQKAETRQRLIEAANGQSFVGQAPVVIVACAVDADHVMPCGLPSFSIDVAIAMEHIALQATAEGLGTCWIGAFDEASVRKVLDIPGNVRVVDLMPLGYPADEAGPKRRRALSEIAMRERWEGGW
jgi:nitroreductase